MVEEKHVRKNKTKNIERNFVRVLEKNSNSIPWLSIFTFSQFPFFILPTLCQVQPTNYPKFEKLI